MAKTAYHVQYQVFGTIYFEPNQVLSGPDVAHGLRITTRLNYC